MAIKDYSKYYKKTLNTAKHAPFFPKNIFAVIAGSTGCGKTNLLVNLLFNDGFLDYGSVYIYSPTLYQPAYQYVKDRYKETENAIWTNCKKKVTIGHFFVADEEIKDPKELDSNINHIMVFDDVLFSDPTKIKEYFCRGRHNNVNVFYLCQSFFAAKKHDIRENANVFILFHQEVKTLKSFHEFHVSGDMDFKEFKQFCDNAWSKKHGFVVINIWEEAHLGRYISNYEDIYTPSKYK